MYTQINFKKALLTISVFISSMAVYASSATEDLLFVSHLDGEQVVPAVSTNATGVASFMLNSTRDSLMVNASVIGTSITSAGVYYGSEGIAGTLLIDLTNEMMGNSITTAITGSDLNDNLPELIRGNLYVQLSSMDNPSGELRGQIGLAADWSLVASLSAAEAIPSNASTAYGLGSFELTMDKEQLNFKVICQNLSGDISSVKLHTGAVGVVGDEIEDLSVYIDGNTIYGSVSASIELLTGIFSEEVYLNVSTADYPEGQVRSQLRLREGLSFEVLADGEQIVSGFTSYAQALGVFRLSPTLDSLYYDVVATGNTSPINYIHFHVGNYGQSYGALSLDFTSSIDGNHVQGVLTGASISNTNINRLLKANLALILHTGSFPNGEVRGQSVKLAHEGYSLKLEGAQEVPQVSTTAYGSGVVSVSRAQDKAYYHWVAGELSSMATGSHLAHAAAGSVGPVLHDMGADMTALVTEASARGVWSTADVLPFSTANADLLADNVVYLNVTTANHPDGEIRGQVLAGAVSFSSTSTSLTEFSTESMLVSVYPNPCSGVVTLQSKRQLSNYAIVDIMDMSGRIVFRSSVGMRQGGMQVDLSDIQAGVYMLRLSDGSEVASEVLVKQ